MFANDMKIILLISNFSSIALSNFGNMSKLYFFGLNKIFIKKYIKEGRVDYIRWMYINLFSKCIGHYKW